MSNAPTTRTLCTFSATRGSGWQGDAPVDLSNVFRFFNRVDREDGPRLEAIGYDLPSLTAGDLVGFIDGTRVQWYLCAATGWDEITDAQAQEYMIRAQNTPRADYPPLFAKVVDQVLEFLHDGKRVYIGPSGQVAVTFA